jgi:hypothetical protein
MPTEKQWPPGHTFRDPGPAVDAPDFRPRIYGNPERLLESAFLRMKRDYGGPINALDDLARVMVAAER